MAAVMGKMFGWAFRLLSAVGPIFTKELRVSSRQRRQYVMRFAYLAVLTVFVVLVWLTVVRFEEDESGSFRIERMGEVGKTIIVTIVWFQFIAAQVLAIILMSTSISDEIYRGTLGVLMTTPLTCFQIVAGKLFSRLLPILVLLAISFPLMAIVRVFGGVPWSYVVAGLAVTVTNCIFVGAVTMIFSIRHRRAYVTVLASLGAQVAYNGLLPLVLLLSCLAFFLVYFINPYAVLIMLTAELMSPGGMGGMAFYFCPVHCVLMLAGSVGILFLSAYMLKKKARQEGAGQALVPVSPVLSVSPAGSAVALPLPPARSAEAQTPPLPPAPARSAQAPPPPLPPAPPDTPTPIRRIEGSPILWKEFQKPVLGGSTMRSVVLAVSSVVLLLTYLFMLPFDALGKGGVQAFFVVTYLVVGLAWSALLAATTITPEKEARCWPLLMATALSDNHILLAKVLGVLRRSLPAWLLLAAHTCFFTLIGYLHPVALVHVLLVSAGTLVFLLGLCTYFSARFRRTTSAVVCSLTAPLLLWVALPAVIAMIVEAAGAYDVKSLTVHLAANPVVQVITAVMGATNAFGRTGLASGPAYVWPFGRLGMGDTTKIIALSSLVYAGLGCLLTVAARRSFRKRIF